MFSRFQNGPCGILCRCVSPSVSANAPHEQIHPQYAPLPQKKIIAGISTNVCMNPRISQPQIGSAVNQFHAISGHARINPYARHQLSPGKNVRSIHAPTPLSNHPIAFTHGSTNSGKINSGTTWIVASVTVCHFT